MAVQDNNPNQMNPDSQSDSQKVNEEALLFDEATILSRDQDAAKQQDKSIDTSNIMGSARDSGRENIQSFVDAEHNAGTSDSSAGSANEEAIAANNSLDETSLLGRQGEPMQASDGGNLGLATESLASNAQASQVDGYELTGLAGESGPVLDTYTTAVDLGVDTEAEPVDNSPNLDAPVTPQEPDTSTPTNPEPEPEPEPEKEPEPEVQVTLSAEDALEGKDITITAKVEGNFPPKTDLVITLDNGQVITIKAGEFEGSITFDNPNEEDVYLDSSTETFIVTDVAGGGYENLTVQDSVEVTVADTIDDTTLTLSAEPVLEGEQITVKAEVDHAPETDLTITLDNGEVIVIKAGETSGEVTFDNSIADNVYAEEDRTITVKVESTEGGNYENLLDDVAVDVTVTDEPITPEENQGDEVQVTLSAEDALEGKDITITAKIEGNFPPKTDLIITLDNGETITIKAGQFEGSVTFDNPNEEDVYLDASTETYLVDSVTGGGYENLTVQDSVEVTVADTIDDTTLTLSAEPVLEGEQITVKAEVDHAPETDLTITLDNGEVIVIKAGDTSGEVSFDSPAASANDSDEGRSVNIKVSATDGGNYENLVTDDAAIDVEITPLPEANIDVAIKNTITEITLGDGSSITLPGNGEPQEGWVVKDSPGAYHEPGSSAPIYIPGIDSSSWGTVTGTHNENPSHDAQYVILEGSPDDYDISGLYYQEAPTFNTGYYGGVIKDLNGDRGQDSINFAFIKGIIFTDGTIIETGETKYSFKSDVTINIGLDDKGIENADLSEVTVTLDGITAEDISEWKIGDQPLTDITVNADGTITLVLPEGSVAADIQATVNTQLTEWGIEAEVWPRVEGEKVGEVAIDQDATQTLVGEEIIVDTTPEPPTITFDDALVVYEAGLETGTEAGDGSNIAEGSFTITSKFPLDSINISGQEISLADLEAGDISVNVPNGVMKITGYDEETGIVNYEYTLTEAHKHDKSKGEDDLAIKNIEISAKDVNGYSSDTSFELKIWDDSPTGSNTNLEAGGGSIIVVPVAQVDVGNLEAGFTNWEGGNRQTKAENKDDIPGQDTLTWGDNSSKSGYDFKGNAEYKDVAEDIINTQLNLGTFTHTNKPIPSGSAITGATLTVELDVIIDGQKIHIKHDIELEHYETPNTNGGSNGNATALKNRDEVTIKEHSLSKVINVGGKDYLFKIDGFLDKDGNLVDKIYTWEDGEQPRGETNYNSFDLFASIESTDPLPVVSGNAFGDDASVNDIFGADGAAEENAIVWENGVLLADGSTQIEGEYGTLIVDASGNYTFELNRETYDNFKEEGKVVEFKYTTTDADGDSAEHFVKIDLKGVVHENHDGQDTGLKIAGSDGNDYIIGSSGNDLIAGGEGDDTLFGGDGDDILIGGKGNDTLTGGEGKDTFVWLKGDAGTSTNPATDTITDFELGVDQLDISNLLVGYDDNADLSNYLAVEEDKQGNVQLQINSQGELNNGPDQIIVLEGVTKEQLQEALDSIKVDDYGQPGNSDELNLDGIDDFFYISEPAPLLKDIAEEMAQMNESGFFEGGAGEGSDTEDGFDDVFDGQSADF